MSSNISMRFERIILSVSHYHLLRLHKFLYILRFGGWSDQCRKNILSGLRHH